jgi:hypothetical protein
MNLAFAEFRINVSKDTAGVEHQHGGEYDQSDEADQRGKFEQ